MIKKLIERIPIRFDFILNFLNIKPKIIHSKARNKLGEIPANQTKSKTKNKKEMPNLHGAKMKGR